MKHATIIGRKLLFLFVLLFSSYSFAETLYVPGDFSKIQTAIDSSSAGDSIIVSSGRFEPFKIVNKYDLSLIGTGFSISTPDPEDDSVIDTQRSGRCFLVSHSYNILISGFNFMNGSEDFGGGDGLIIESDVTIRNSIIQKGEVHNCYPNYGGGGILIMVGSLVKMEYCVIQDNHSDYLGANLYLMGGSLLSIKGSIIKGGHSDWLTSGIYSANSELLVFNNLFEYQTSGSIRSFYSYAKILNNVFSNNYLTDEPLISSLYYPIIIMNNIFYDNHRRLGDPTIAFLSGDSTYQYMLNHNLYFQNDTNAFHNCVPGPDSINADPMFVDPVNGDFRLRLGSPAIDSGDPDPYFSDPGENFLAQPPALGSTTNDIGMYGGDYSEPFVELEDFPEKVLRKKTFRIRWNYDQLFKINLFYSLDDGASWNTIGLGVDPDIGSYEWQVPDTISDCIIRVESRYARKFVFSEKSTCLSDDLTGVSPSEGLAEDFILFQNYPNPFNSSTKITYHTSKAGPVSLTVYDVQGRKIATLLEGSFEPIGRHVVIWNADGMASGTYIYILRSVEGVRIKKMVLMR